MTSGPRHPIPHALVRLAIVVAIVASIWLPAPVRAAGGPAHLPARLPQPAISESTAGAIDRLEALAEAPPVQTTRIFDRYGNLLYELSDEGKRTIVPLGTIPKALLNATIATEDKNFYLHGGIDLSAIARAAYQNWNANSIVSGASTIPQQLVRTLVMGEASRYDLSMNRKLREASLAMDLSGLYSKDQILEMYLNTIYYGHQAYGVQAAAETYFRKDVSELTLAECALLAGLPQSPAFLDPFIHPGEAQARQHVVLELMAVQGYITKEQKEEAQAEPLRYLPPELPVLRAPHFVDYVRELLLERYGSEGLRRGLQVYTSIDLRFQQIAEQIARAQIEEISHSTDAHNAAVVLIHPPTAQILAMVGSIDYYDDSIDGQVNVATSPRQPGSWIKPVVYATAFANGWTPASPIWDGPVAYRTSNGAMYQPHNVTGRYYGALRLRTSLANSLNVPAIKLLQQVGIPKVLETAKRMGIDSWRNPPETYGLSLTLGGYEVPLVELTHAFATIANSGAYVPLSPIMEIRDNAGRVLFKAEVPDPPQYAIPPTAAYQIANVLSDTRVRQLIFGRNSPLDTSQPTAVKTGTTDNYRDNLTAGFTPYLAVGIWVGNSDGKPLRNSLAYRSATPIFHDIFEAIWATPSLFPTLGFVNEPLPQGFTPPPGIIKAPVCDLLAGRFDRACTNVYEDVFAAPAVDNSPVLGGAPVYAPEQRGYCLPPIQTHLPATVAASLAFVPVPDQPADRTVAQSWSSRNGLGLQRYADCNKKPVVREPVKAQPLPKPQRLVFVAPRVARTPGFLPGNRVTLSKSVQGLNIRSQPGTQGNILGSLHHGQIALIRQGPVKAESSNWLQVRVVDSGLVGWVLARSLELLPPPEADTAGQATSPLPTTEAAPAGSKPSETATPADTPAPADTSAPVLETDSATPTPEPMPLPAAQAATPIRFKPDLAALEIRAYPYAKAPLLSVITHDQRYVVVGGPQDTDGTKWYPVAPEGNDVAYGWVDGSFLASAGTTSQAP